MRIARLKRARLLVAQYLWCDCGLIHDAKRAAYGKAGLFLISYLQGGSHKRCPKGPIVGVTRLGGCR